jgi:prepilin-type N-terminal cleavage/methylation domain-containing protein
MTRRDRSASAGFTLIEILVAFTIATTSLGLLYQIHANSTATILLSQDYQQATELAQSLVVDLAATKRSVSFTEHGVAADKYRWTVRAAELTPGSNGAERAPFRLRDVSVVVSWRARDKERHVSLHTAKPYFEQSQ